MTMRGIVDSFVYIVTFRWLLPDGIPLQEARYRFISFILSLLIISVFAIGIILYIGLDRLNTVEQFNQGTLRHIKAADSSDAIFQKMYLQQYNDYQKMLDAEKSKQSQIKETTDGTDKKR